MEKFEISVTVNKKNQHFEVIDYMHHEGDQCKFEIFQNGVFVGSLEPDGHKSLGICKDAGVIEKAVLYLIATQLEAYNI